MSGLLTAVYILFPAVLSVAECHPPVPYLSDPVT